MFLSFLHPLGTKTRRRPCLAPLRHQSAPYTAPKPDQKLRARAALEISKLPEGRGCATIEAKINYFRPVQSGRIVARGSCPRMTRRTAYAEGVITDEAGNELARASGTFMLTDTIAQTDRERV